MSEPTAPRGKQQVKQALIEAGIKLFSERGMASVSVRELAETAGVNHSLLFRHFGGKDALIQAVFEERFNRQGIFNNDDTVAGEAMLETSIRAVMKDEQLWRLMTFAALEGKENLLTAIPSPYLSKTLKRLQQRQDEGEIYNGVEAPVLLASGFALGLGWAVFRRLLMVMAQSSERDFEELRLQVDRLWEDIIAPATKPAAQPEPGKQKKGHKRR